MSDTMVRAAGGLLAALLIAAAAPVEATHLSKDGLARGRQIITRTETIARDEPALSSAGAASTHLGRLGVITGGPADSGYTWWRVDFVDGPDGWSKADKLVCPTSLLAELPSGGWRSPPTYGQAPPSSSQRQNIREKAGVYWASLELAHDYSRGFTSTSSVL